MASKPAGGKKGDAAAKAAQKAAERKKAAEDAFATADADDSGSVDAKELEFLLVGLLQREGIAFQRNTVTEFVKAEFEKADSDGSGDVDFDEFIDYYNLLLDRISGGAMNEALESAKKATARKLEEAAIAEDDGVFLALHTLLGMLRAPSMHTYTGLVLPFKLRDNSEYSTPNPEHGSSSHGLILDLSRRAQRLLTPWGSFPIGYRLAFTGYQERTPPAEEDEGGGKKKAKKAATTPWPLIPAKKDREEPENESLFFTLCKKKLGEGGTELVLRKCPMRCHFQVVEIQGVAQPKGEAVAVGADERKKLLDRWQAQLKKHPKEPKITLPAEDAEGGPLVNFLAGACVAVRLDRLEAVKKRKEVTGRAANKRFEEHELITALKLCSNKDDLAAKFAVKMQGLENQVYDEKPGHATRSQVKYALQTCEFNKEGAISMLFSPQGEKLLKPKTEYILERLGLDTGLGYPSTQLVERLLVKSNYDEGAAMADLKKRYKLDIAMQAEIVAAAEVEEMLTPERCDTFAFSRPATAEDAQRVEDLYLGEFKRDKAATLHFFTEAGTVLKRSISLGSPSREEVEGLLRQMNNESERVIAFLTSQQNLIEMASKNGNPTREDCARYLHQCDRDETQAKTFMQTIWKIHNPKAPKPPPKGSKKPPQEHYSLKCGYPSSEEAEWALLGTRDESKEGKPLFIDKAVELLCKLDVLTQEVKGLSQAYPGTTREDIVWALDPERCAALLKVRPLSNEEYASGQSAATLILGGISHLIQRGKETGVATSRPDLLASLEKLKFDQTKTEKWLNGVGTLMERQAELGIVSREEVEVEMERHELDDAKVIELFEDTFALTKRKAEIGSPSRAEIKAMLTRAWNEEQRLELTAKCVSVYKKVLGDESFILSLFGKVPDEAELDLISTSILRFKGDYEQSAGYLKKVADICQKGDMIGNPTRDHVVEVLDKHNLDQRKATQEIREAYHKRRDEQLKEEYKKNKAAAEAKRAADAQAQ